VRRSRKNFRTLKISRDAACPVCGASPTIRELRAENYAEACAPARPNSVSTDAADYPLESPSPKPKRLLSEEACTALLVDVREPYETENLQDPRRGADPQCEQIPERMHDLPRDEHLLIMCHVGARSMRVTEFLRAPGLHRGEQYRGGISAWARRSIRRCRATDRYARSSECAAT